MDLDPAAVVVFHVRDLNGRPFVGEVMVGHSMGAKSEGVTTRTDETRSVRHARLPTGKGTISVGAQGYTTWSSTVDLGTGELSVDAVLAPAPVAPTDPKLATLAGRIVEKGTGRAISGVRLDISNHSDSAFTDADGRWRATGLVPESTFRVALVKDGWGLRSIDIPRPAGGQETTLDETWSRPARSGSTWPGPTGGTMRGTSTSERSLRTAPPGRASGPP